MSATCIALTGDDLARIPSPTVERAVEACERLGLRPAGGEGLAWSGQRAAALAGATGALLAEALEQAQPAALPFLGHVPVDPAGARYDLLVPAGREPSLPWELGQQAGCPPWGLDDRVAVAYRAHWSDARTPEVALSAPLRVVVVSCMPAGVPSANVDAQRVALAQAMGRLPRSWLPRHEWHEAPSVEALRTALSEPLALLHVVAHGRQGEILWHDDGRPRWLSAEAFCDLCAGLEIPFVSFSVCDSAHSEANGAYSLAATATRTFARSAVGMRGLLSDTSGHAYFAGLLKPLSGGDTTVARMVTEARRELARTSAAVDWLRPALFVRDGVPSLHVTSPSDETEPSSAPIDSVAQRWLETPGGRLPLSTGPVSIGRSAAADLVVDGPGVAPFAAVVDVGAEGCEVRDQDGSGVLVDGERVERGWLADGSELVVGDATVVLREGPSRGG